MAKQHERGKPTARERLAQFFDGGEFFEVGIHGTQMGAAGESDKPPADAVICGYGPVNGAWWRPRPTTSRSKAARSARPARSRSAACAS